MYTVLFENKTVQIFSNMLTYLYSQIPSCRIDLTWPECPEFHGDYVKKPYSDGFFQRFLKQTGGNRGGWDEYDHGTFMKFINRHKVSG